MSGMCPAVKSRYFCFYPSLPMPTTGHRTLDEVIRMMRGQGASRVYAKSLAANDNSKNQVYLGGDFGLLSVLPSGEPRAASSGAAKTPIFKSTLQLEWLDDDGVRHRAPRSQLILYPQYPEVRLSGFLSGAAWAPSDVMATREPGRVLILGVGVGDTVLAYAASAGSSAAHAIDRAPVVTRFGVLTQLALDGVTRLDPQSRLLAALCTIASKEWIAPWRLGADGQHLPCNGTNCVGVTLESELGIASNGRSEPDFDGWEVKAHTVSSFESTSGGVLTLMTPEPNLGLYVEEGVEAFVRRYGYPDVAGRPDRLNFGGVHRVGERASRTKLSMQLRGFDQQSGKITDASGSIVLLDEEANIAAGWNFAGLLSHWKRKHSRAAFVPAMKLPGANVRYRYSSQVKLGIDTDYLMLLRGLASKSVYYDPGIKLENASTAPRTKRRSQFRIKSSELRALYRNFLSVDACADGS